MLTTASPLLASLIAEVAQAIYFTTPLDFISNLNAFIVSFILTMFASVISPVVNASCPKRIGTRTNELFLNFGSLPFSSIMLEINILTAFEPISIAAYFFIIILLQ